MTSTLIAPPPVTEGIQRAVLATLTINAWSTSIMDKTITNEVTVAKKASVNSGRFTKRLLPKAATKDLSSIASDAREAHNFYTMPWNGRGTRLLPTAVMQAYDDQMLRLKQDYEDARNRFCDSYYTNIDEARAWLGDMFRREEYPSVAKVRESIEMSVLKEPVPNVDSFLTTEGISPEEVEQLRRDLERENEARLQVANTNLFERLYEVVSRATERLEETNDGKPKTFRDSMITNMQELVSLMPSMNLSNDPRITSMTESLQATLEGLEPNMLRPGKKNAAFDSERRQQLKQELDRTSALLSAYRPE